MEYNNITAINEIVHFNNIINHKYINDLNKNILSIDYKILEKKVYNVRYESFDHIQSFEDLNKLKIINILNFLIDNRYDLNKIIRFKNNKSISDIRFTKIINTKDIGSWFNYYSVVAIISKLLAQKNK